MASPKSQHAQSPRPAPTIYEVAKRVGMSPGTVSRILNGGNKEKWASAAKRGDQIRRVAKEMGYLPDFRASSLKQRRSRCIGLLAAAKAAPFREAAMAAVAVAAALVRHDYDLMIIPAAGPSDTWSHKLKDRRVDGCLVVYPEPPDLAQVMAEARVPSVMVNVTSDAQLPCVKVDDCDGARQMMRHLIGLGHRRIAYYKRAYPASPIRDHYSVVERLSGYDQELASSGLADLRMCVEGSAEQFADQIARMRREDRPTAVLCYADNQAVDLVFEMWKRGIHVPTDISVAGFNDDDQLRHFIPPLTTVAPPWEQMAQTAVDLLIEAIEMRQPVQQSIVTLPEKLVVRQSTARPWSN